MLIESESADRVENMKILALETTETLGSVAVMLDGNLFSEMDLDRKQRSAQSLAPAIGALLDRVGWRAAEVQLVAVSRGPGSFTGLRVGITAAKVFAYAVGAEVLGVDTLEAIAAAAPREVSAVSVGVDAQRGQVAARHFTRCPDGWFAPAGPEMLLDIDVWLGGLPPDAVPTGPVLRKLGDRLPVGVRSLAPECWPARASMIAQLAARDYARGRRDDLWTLLPHYCRQSAAEEKWAKRHEAT